MRIELVLEEGEVVSFLAEGNITQNAFLEDEEPLSRVLGPQVYQRHVLLGFGRATFVDSRGVGWILKCHKRCREAGGVLVLHSLPGPIREVLAVLRLDQIFEIADDEATARSRAAEATFS